MKCESLCRFNINGTQCTTNDHETFMVSADYISTVCDKSSWITSNDLHWDKSPHVFVVEVLDGRWERFREQIPQRHLDLKLRMCLSYQLYRLCSPFVPPKFLQTQTPLISYVLEIRYLALEGFTSRNHKILLYNIPHNNFRGSFTLTNVCFPEDLTHFYFTNNSHNNSYSLTRSTKMLIVKKTKQKNLLNNNNNNNNKFKF